MTGGVPEITLTDAQCDRLADACIEDGIIVRVPAARHPDACANLGTNDCKLARMNADGFCVEEANGECQPA